MKTLIQRAGPYEIEDAGDGVWFLVDPKTKRIRSTFFKDGRGRWRGTTPTHKVAIEKLIDDDADDPHLTMALYLADM